MRRWIQRPTYVGGVYVVSLRFTDREHGRTAPAYLRKHCAGCGKTLPNRSRSWVCPECYPEYRSLVKMLSERRRRMRARSAMGR